MSKSRNSATGASTAAPVVSHPPEAEMLQLYRWEGMFRVNHMLRYFHIKNGWLYCLSNNKIDAETKQRVSIDAMDLSTVTLQKFESSSMHEFCFALESHRNKKHKKWKLAAKDASELLVWTDILHGEGATEEGLLLEEGGECGVIQEEPDRELNQKIEALLRRQEAARVHQSPCVAAALADVHKALVQLNAAMNACTNCSLSSTFPSASTSSTSTSPTSTSTAESKQEEEEASTSPPSVPPCAQCVAVESASSDAEEVRDPDCLSIWEAGLSLPQECAIRSSVDTVVQATVFGGVGTNFLRAINPQHWAVLQAADKSYWNVLKGFLNPNLEFVSYIAELVPKTELDRVAQAVINIARLCGTCVPMLRVVILRECLTCNQEQTLFRASSVASKMIGFYCQAHVETFCLESKAVQTLIGTCVAAGARDDFNPIATAMAVLQALKDFLEGLRTELREESAIHSCAELRVTAYIVQQEVSKVFPDASTTIVAGFLFLRWINPLLIDASFIQKCFPEGVDASKANPRLKKNVRVTLMEVTRVLQKLANNSRYNERASVNTGVDPRVLNDFIDENMAVMSAYLNAFAVPSEADFFRVGEEGEGALEEYKATRSDLECIKRLLGDAAKMDNQRSFPRESIAFNAQPRHKHQRNNARGRSLSVLVQP
jgi:hypothetical protein